LKEFEEFKERSQESGGRGVGEGLEANALLAAFIVLKNRH
jgi:hypothetical protein